MHSKSPLGSKQGHSGQDPGAPAPQSSVAWISCSRVRFFMPFNLLCQSAFQRAVIARIFTSADFLTLETAVVSATVVAVKMCAHHDSGFLLIHRPPPPFLHSSSLYTVPDPLRKLRSADSFRRSNSRGISSAHPLHPAWRSETSQKVLRVGLFRVFINPFLHSFNCFFDFRDGINVGNTVAKSVQRAVTVTI